MKVKNAISWLCFYILPLFYLISSIFYPSKDMFAELGVAALIIVFIILIVKPLAVITKHKFFWRIIKYRRELGVLAFWMALFHAAGLIYVLKIYDPSFYLDPTIYLFWGAVAFLGMLILGLTSNNYSVRLLKRNWKKLHYIVYPTFFAVVIHAAMICHWSYYLMIPIFIVLKGWQYYVEKKKK